MDNISDDIARKWTKFEKMCIERFGEILPVEGILFIIGLQELGKPSRKFSKTDKTDIIQIGIMSLLALVGYFEKKGRDENGWPVYNPIKPIPPMSSDEQEKLFKKLICRYFEID